MKKIANYFIHCPYIWSLTLPRKSIGCQWKARVQELTLFFATFFFSLAIRILYLPFMFVFQNQFVYLIMHVILRHEKMHDIS